MNRPPSEHQKLLQHIDQLLAEAPDEASRLELQRLRDRVTAPEMVEMARELESSRPRQDGNLALEFHDPLLPTALTATGCVIATTVCLFAIVQGFQSPLAWVMGTQVNLWVVAAFAGACSVMFSALSFMRPFSIRFDTEGMISRTSGARWRRLHTGAMRWKNIRALTERADGVLQVTSASGEAFEIPLRVVNYPILHQHLENMVRLYGDNPPS